MRIINDKRSFLIPLALGIQARNIGPWNRVSPDSCDIALQVTILERVYRRRILRVRCLLRLHGLSVLHPMVVCDRG